MKLRCTKCDNKTSFMAEARHNIFVIIDGDGKITDNRKAQQQYKDKEIVVLKPWKCNSCGSVGRIEDLDKKVGGTETCL